jgi:hypothetical protein
MTTQRSFRPLQLSALVAAFVVAMTFMFAPSALAQIGGVGDVTGTVGGAGGGATGGATDTVNETVGGTTDTVNETVGGATDTVNETVGGATDTVNGTVGSTTDTVNETVGGATGTVNETVGGVTDTVNETVGGGSGSGSESSPVSGPAGSKGTATQSGGELSSSGGVAGGGANGDEVRTVNGEPVPPGATVIKLPDGSTVVIPGNAGGEIEGKKVFGNGSLPKEVLVALNGLIDGFASAGASTPLATDRPSAADGPTFFDNASQLAAEAAKKLAFPTTLAVIVFAFLMIHGRVGRRDPKLAQARVETHEDALTFR